MHTNPGPENKRAGTSPVQRDLSFLAEYAKLWPMQSYHDHPIMVCLKLPQVTGKKAVITYVTASRLGKVSLVEHLCLHGCTQLTFILSTTGAMTTWKSFLHFYCLCLFQLK